MGEEYGIEMIAPLAATESADPRTNARCMATAAAGR
jgi:hypothetical protein